MKFAIRDQVIIDDGDVSGFVTAMVIQEGRTMVEVSWLHNGIHYSSYFDDWRLKKAKA